MIKQKAIELLNDTFSHDFEINRFSKFVKELLNEFDLNVQDKTSFIAKKYEDYIESLEKLGDWKDKKGKEIEVFVVKLKKASSRDRARTMQRDFIANLLEEKDAALVAFYGEDPQDWRFSYVKMEYNLVKEDSGKSKPVKELTPAKRYSFLVGVNEPNHTCASRFLKLIMEEEIDPSLEEIEQAFSVEKVTKEFFDKYKELYLRLEESLQKVIKKDSKVKAEFEDNGIETVDFTKKLLGQIVFLYFLQKKGWLGVEKNEMGNLGEWGTGPKNFMRKLFDGKLGKYNNFFNDILEPLFYEALATERDDDYYSRFKCKIPFLNGGLFEPINDYNWRETDIFIDNDIFRVIFNTFDEFNFTVKEDEPLEKEVAVDPEMLGKVFENLLEVKDRKSKGAFYTPREIVHYMCQQSLINYLETNTSINRKDIENFVQNGDNYLALTLLYESKNINTTSEWTLPKSIKENYKEIDRLLKEIKIVDPAVGSGAFPVGMMNEIVKARSILSIYFKENRNDYDLKRETIENCLYGVDIEPSAVEITKLRFWLSLIVDELDMGNIKPLPNLDHKIMCGNSLLEEFEGVKLFDERLLGEVVKDSYEEINKINKEINELYKASGDKSKEIKSLENKKKKLQKEMKKDKETQQITLDDSLANRIKESKRKLNELKKLQKQFFNEQNKKVKKQLRENIDRIEWELIEETLKEQGNEEAIKKLEQIKKSKSKPFFLWKLYFAEVFQRDNPGFDIVIANPPYDVIYSSKQPDYYQVYKKIYASAEYNPNLFAMFIEKSITLLRQKGNLGFIIPDTLLTNKYFKNIRNNILNEGQILEILDLRGGTFEHAIVDNIIFEFEKINAPKKEIYIGYGINSSKELGIHNFKRKKIPQNKFMESNNNEFNIYFDNSLDKIKNKMMDISVPLGEISNIKRGMVTKNNKLFVIPNLKETKFSKDKLKPLLVGKDATRYYLSYSDNFIYFDKSAKGGGCWDKNIYEAKEKIIIALITGGMKYRINATYDKNQFYVLQNYNNLIVTDKRFETKYILALLNSRLINNYYEIFFNDKNIKRVQLQQLPIAIASQAKQKPIIRLVDQILPITSEKCYFKSINNQEKVKKLDKEIDKLVYKLYELTSEEIKIVEDFNKK